MRAGSTHSLSASNDLKALDQTIEKPPANAHAHRIAIRPNLTPSTPLQTGPGLEATAWSLVNQWGGIMGDVFSHYRALHVLEFIRARYVANRSGEILYHARPQTTSVRAGSCRVHSRRLEYESLELSTSKYAVVDRVRLRP